MNQQAGNFSDLKATASLSQSKFSMQAEKVEKARYLLSEAISNVERQFYPVMGCANPQCNKEDMPSQCEFETFINSTVAFLSDSAEQLNSLCERSVV